MLFFGGDNNDLEQCSRVFVTYDGHYENLPKSNEEKALDDVDDWVMEQQAAVEESGTDTDDWDKDLHMTTSTIRLILKKEVLLPLYQHLQKVGAVQAKVNYANGILSREYVAYTDKWLFHIINKWGGIETDSTPIEYMAFYVEQKNYVYCGYHRQVRVKIYNPIFRKEIKEHCKKIAPRLNEKGDDFKSPWFGRLKDLFNIPRWIHPDRLTLSDNAVIYTRKTFRKDEMTYLPYAKINMFVVSKGVFRRIISFYGEQNIVPKYTFKTSDTKKIMEIVESHSVHALYGDSFRSSAFFSKNWFGKAPRVVCFDNNMIYYPNRLKNKTIKALVEYLDYSDCQKVTWYRPWFNFFGTLVIEGASENIRLDQGNMNSYWVLPQLWTFRYKWFIFSGGLRNKLTSKTSAEFKTYRKAYGE